MMNRQRFVGLSIAGGLAGTLTSRVPDPVLPSASTRSGLGCRISYVGGDRSDIALKPLDSECVRHFSMLFRTQHSRSIRSIEVGLFEPTFCGLEIFEPFDLDTELRRGESIAVTYFSGSSGYPAWFTAFLKRPSGQDELLVTNFGTRFRKGLLGRGLPDTGRPSSGRNP